MGNKRGAMYNDTWKLHRIEISVSINKVLLEHGHAHFTCIIYGCFCATMTKMSSVTGTIWPEKLNVILRPFTKKFANSCFKWIFLLHSPPQSSEVGKTDCWPDIRKRNRRLREKVIHTLLSGLSEQPPTCSSLYLFLSLPQSPFSDPFSKPS